MTSAFIYFPSPDDYQQVGQSSRIIRKFHLHSLT
ncbi:hypothetical protein HMPREF9990_04448 [Staphylococcus epidermidis NIHLM061]|nr:hypothetical protein HMPREF9995_05365 [Staphylococcus epidermidis NIHLM095]EJD89827.1 hypothetical protein HMPREF9990_04448 [Staphylococcus epidermidis NIHLM061]EJD96862.1 hypothetical protein HMPREF9989_01427 [Staphylococcus epidermidis NIHLM057]EJD98673.1 hypothetical protein HMPREF9988_01778 [Staphylococcus epidermidis NIHLM053]EJD99371.1 hypothetical protein HMPREF9986_06666 [Staphylococcus epidermidis NIHLM040]EJE00894.1 hypothetical protein HMPREF9985_04664 [Staphylococcus epidermidis